jgi:hypothetical protein
MLEVRTGTASVTIALTTVATWKALRGGYMWLEVENALAVNNLDQFELQVRTDPSGAWVAIDGGWDAIDNVVLWQTATAPKATAASTKTHALVFIGPAQEVRLRAAVAGSGAETTTVNVRARCGWDR